MEGELVESDVAGIAPCGIGVGREPVDHRAVREAGLELLDHRAFEESRLRGARDNSTGLDVLLNFFHEQARLPLAFGEEDPGGLSLQATKHGAECCDKRKAN